MVHACIGFHAALWQTDTKAGMCLSRRDVVGCLMTKQQIVGIAIIHDVYTLSFIKDPVPILLNPLLLVVLVVKFKRSILIMETLDGLDMAIFVIQVISVIILLRIMLRTKVAKLDLMDMLLQTTLLFIPVLKYKN